MTMRPLVMLTALGVLSSAVAGFAPNTDGSCNPEDSMRLVTEKDGVPDMQLVAPELSQPLGRIVGYQKFFDGVDVTFHRLMFDTRLKSATFTLSYDFTGSSEYDVDVVLPSEVLTERAAGGAEWTFEVADCDPVDILVYANVRNKLETPDLRATISVAK